MSGPAPRGTVICRQCGRPNAVGDQFCGGCGAFLEWAAEPTEPTTTQAPADAASDTTAPQATAPPGATIAPAQLVRCPTCGTANVAGRTFCQKCGGKLAVATTVTPLKLPPRPPGSADPPPAAPTATRAATTSTRRRRELVDEGGGIPGWLGVAVAGILVGAVAVVIVLLLGSGSPAPPTSASSAPSVSPSTQASASASSAPSGSESTTGAK